MAGGKGKAIKMTTCIMLAVVVTMCGMFYQPGSTGSVYAAGKTAAPKSLKVKAKIGSVTVTFKATKNATKYAIFMAAKNTKTGKIGKYKKIKTITAKVGKKSYAFTKKKLKAGVKYYFKVRSYKGNTPGGITNAKSSFTKMVISPPVIKTIKPLSNCGAVLTFNSPVQGAAEYAIQYKVGSNGKWNKSGSIKTKEHKTSVPLTGEESVAGKTVYFRMTVKTKISAKKVKSAFCKVKSVRIPKKSQYPDMGYDPNFYMDNDGYHCEGGVSSYVKMFGNGAKVINGKAYTVFHLDITSSSCYVMYTGDGTEPSETNGTKLTKKSPRVDGDVIILTDRNSPTIKLRIYDKRDEKVYLTLTNKYLIDWEKHDNTGFGLKETNGYFTQVIKDFLLIVNSNYRFAS